MFILKYLKAKCNKIQSKNPRDKKRVDEDWPLNIRIGSTVRVDETPFILADGRTKMVKPEGDMVVKAAGYYRQASLKQFRFYLSDLEGQEFMLQIGLGADDERIDCLYLFSLVEEIIPESKEDWGIWLGEEEGFIGKMNFQHPDEALYQRAWQQSGGERVTPQLVVEVVADDPYDEDLTTLRHQLMLYSREIGPEMKEHCLLETVEGNNESSIVVYVGLQLEETVLTVL